MQMSAIIKSPLTLASDSSCIAFFFAAWALLNANCALFCLGVMSLKGVGRGEPSPAVTAEVTVRGAVGSELGLCGLPVLIVSVVGVPTGAGPVGTPGWMALSRVLTLSVLRAAEARMAARLAEGVLGFSGTLSIAPAVPAAVVAVAAAVPVVEVALVAAAAAAAAMERLLAIED